MASEYAPVAAPAPNSAVTTIATGFATPLLLLGGATIYFAGTMYRSTLLGYFGLPSNIVSESIQTTMAVGYLTILIVFSSLAVGGCFGYLIGVGVARFSSKPAIPNAGARQAFKTITILYFFGISIGSGWVAGRTAATNDFNRIIASVSGGCPHCYLYKTSKGLVVGLPIMGDERQILIATRRGVAVLPVRNDRP